MEVSRFYTVFSKRQHLQRQNQIAYFEVPIEGDGTLENPFKAKMPQEIVINPDINPRAYKQYKLLKEKGFTDDEIEASLAYGHVLD